MRLRELPRLFADETTAPVLDRQSPQQDRPSSGLRPWGGSDSMSTHPIAKPSGIGRSASSHSTAVPRVQLACFFDGSVIVGIVKRSDHGLCCQSMADGILGRAVCRFAFSARRQSPEMLSSPCIIPVQLASILSGYSV